MYRVLWAYLKQQYSSLTAYKSAFCMTLVNVFIRIYAYAMLWMTLYKQNASLFGNIDLNQMLLYSIFSISLSDKNKCVDLTEVSQIFNNCSVISCVLLSFSIFIIFIN